MPWRAFWRGAKELDHIRVPAARICGGWTTNLHYADDMLILIRNNPREIRNLKFVLVCFQAMENLKINFERSEAFVTGGEVEEQWGWPT